MSVLRVLRIERGDECSLSVLAMPIDSLGASGYPALQTFLSHILDKKNRFLLFSSKMFFVLQAAMTVEVLEEAI